MNGTPHSTCYDSAGGGITLDNLCYVNQPLEDGPTVDSQPAIIGRSAEKANIWLTDVAAELKESDRQYAYRVLRAVLHALRERLTIDACAKLSVQLPTLIRGIYYEDWDPSSTPMPAHTADNFLEHVVSEGRFSGETEATIAVNAVMAVLRKRLAPAEIDAIVTVLPEKLRASTVEA